MTRAIIALALVACGRSTELPTNPGLASYGVRTTNQDSAMISTLRWRTHTAGSVGLAFDVVDGSDVREGNNDAFAYVAQDAAAGLGAWIGKDITLAWWRGRFGAQAVIGLESTATVCGRPGTRQEVSAPAESATGVFRGSDGNFGHIEHRVAAKVHVAVAGSTAVGIPFVVTWVVDADRRDALRADEDHFLASIRCL